MELQAPLAEASNTVTATALSNSLTSSLTTKDRAFRCQALPMLQNWPNALVDVVCSAAKSREELHEVLNCVNDQRLMIVAVELRVELCSNVKSPINSDAVITCAFDPRLRSALDASAATLCNHVKAPADTERVIACFATQVQGANEQEVARGCRSR